MAYDTSARARTTRIYRVVVAASSAAVVVVTTVLGIDYRVVAGYMCCRTWWWIIGGGGDIDEPESLGDWNTVTVYACNRALRGVGAEGRGVIDGCHYQLTRSRHHRVGQLIPGLVPLLCGLTSAQVIHWRPRLFIIALVLYIYIYIIRN